MPTSLRAALAVALVIAGCSRDRSHRRQIGVALPVDSGAIASELQRGMQQPADSLGFELVVAAAGGDPARQAAQLDSFVARRVAAVLIDPADGGDSAIIGAIARAGRARVPVFTVATGTAAGPVVAHIGSDDRMGGELLGWWLAQRLHGGGNLAVLDQPGAAIARDRVAGIRLALSRFPNIRIVASPAVEPASREAARRKTATLLAADQRIDALVGTSDELALGALEGVEAAGRRDVLVAGFGATAEGRAAIARGSPLVADVMPDLYTIGRYAVLVAASHLRGNRVVSVVPVAVHLVTQDSSGAPP
jgi:ribose transport system substrate-binding protein